MRFKDWLLSEDVVDSAGDFFYRLSLYPTDAYDGAAAYIDPRDVWALQVRWRRESEEGRKFYNLKDREYIDHKFTTIQSLTMPGIGSKGWKHSNKDQPNLKVLTSDMVYLGVKDKESSPPKTLPNKVLDTYGLPLNKIFGDDIKIRGDIPSNFDKPWKKVYENITPYQDVGPTRNINTHLGVHSKYVGPDETGEKGTEDTEIADFGFEKPNPYLKKHSKAAYINSKLWRRKYGYPQPGNYVSDQSNTRFDRLVGP